MKIIAKTDKGYLAEVAFSEVKAILSKSDERRKNPDQIIIGDELSFTHALERLTLMKDITLSGSYKTLNYLKDARQALDVVINTVSGLEGDLVKTKSDIEKTGLV